MAIIRVNEDDMSRAEAASDQLSEYYSALSSARKSPATYILRTYGCQLNEADSEKISGMLRGMGLVPSADVDSADVVILNTCAVRENAEDRLFGNLGEYKSMKKEDRNAVLAVCGCMMKVPENVERIRKSFPYVDLVFDPQQLHLFPVMLLEATRRRKQFVDISSDDYIADDSMFPIDRMRKFRALVPIMYGCNNFCTYCIVPFTRGRERSRGYEEILQEITDLARQGYKEVMLLGQNVNSYDGGITFTELLRRVSDIEGIRRIRFMSSHPKDISRELIDLMAERANIEKHLHLPLQSGSSRILRLMNRPYDMKKYLDTAGYFREKIPEGSLTTDIIVGFPGETEEDFCDTLYVTKKVKFDAAFTFQYSRRPGSKAADMPDQVPKEVVTERFARLLQLQNANTFESNMKLAGKVQEVLIEGESSTSPDILTGRTMSNHLINFSIPEELRIEGYSASDYEGMFADVKFTEARPYSVDGYAVELKHG